ncbi:MAG: YciI family protein [Myxococcota bacterium]
MAKQKYLVLFRSQPTGAPGAPPSPEAMQAMFAAYKAWMEKFKADILDMGDKLKPSGRLVTASGVADGPFVEAKELVGGFMIVAAESYEGAVALVQACPAVQAPGALLEIREMAGAKM